MLELDAINPQLASRIARILDRWKHLAEPYRSAAREAIARVAARTELSNDVREIVTRALAILSATAVAPSKEREPMAKKNAFYAQSARRHSRHQCICRWSAADAVHKSDRIGKVNPMSRNGIIGA